MYLYSNMSQISNQFIIAIKQWIKLSHELDTYNNHVKDIRTKKNTLEEQLIHYIQTNNLENNKLIIDKSTISYTKTKSYPPLSIKFIKSVLDSISLKEQIKEMILESIANERKNKGKDTICLKSKFNS